MSSSGNRLVTDVRKLMVDYKVELIDDGMDELDVEFHGPKDSLYEGGVWQVAVVLPDDYPYKPPILRFINNIYHPNIQEETGEICLNVLNESWSPMFDLLNVFNTFLPQLLLDPNPSDPFNDEAAALMKSDLAVYKQRVKEYCEKYAKPEDEAASSEEKTTDEERSEADAHSIDETVAAKPDL